MFLPADMEAGHNTEIDVADALLDVGVSIPVRSFRIPFRRSPVRLRLTMRRPCLGDQIRIARLYLKLGVTYKQLSGFDKDRQMRFMAEHGVTVSRMIALTVCRGPVAGALLAPFAAWFIRRFVEDIYMTAACEKFIPLMGTRPFGNIIRSVEMGNPLAPLSLSREKKRS